MSERMRAGTKATEAKKEISVSRKQEAKVSHSVNSPVHRVLSLQRTIGNQAVQRLIKSGALQAKLKIGSPGDIYEQEADRVAEQVLRMSEPEVLKETKVFSHTQNPIQHRCPVCIKEHQPNMEEEEETLQTKKNSDSTPEIIPDLESRISSISSGGQPLPEPVRAFFEPRFGHDFSQVRVHTDAKAAELATAVDARAFTVGSDVMFGKGEYAHGMDGGQRLLAHELAHVVQQGTGTSKIIQRFKDPYHETIIKSGLKGTDLEQNWKEVYFGSWLRDFSQLIESDSNAAIKQTVTFVLNQMAKEKFGMEVTEQRLGHYVEAEHMDNPDIRPPSTDLPIRSSFTYIKKELNSALLAGRTTDGRIHFGQALHAVQDFFSHTNFVQSIDILCKNPAAKSRRLTSGAFGQKDKEVSILEILVKYVQGKINRSQFSLTPQERAKQWLGKVIPMPQENRIPDVYFQYPRMHQENRIWLEAFDVLTAKLEKTRGEARAAIKVPTHSELHQDDPSRPLYRIASTLAEHITHKLAELMDKAWDKKSDPRSLNAMHQLLEERLQAPQRDGWWKSVLASKGLLKCQ